MNLDWYYTFLVLAEQLNYRKASEKLFLTEPTLHQQIKKLENHLQVELFESIGHTLYLTSLGKDFIPLAKEIIETYETNTDKIKLISKKITKHLDIAVSPYIANYLMPKFLPLFFQEEPQIEISITVLEKISTEIANNTFDIGIDREEPYHKKLHIEQICEGKIQLFVPKLEENLKITSEYEFFKKYRILTDNHPNYWDDLKQKIRHLMPNADFISIKDIAVSEKLIENNEGISYLPSYLLVHANDKIIAIPPNEIPSPISYTFIINLKENDEITRFKNSFRKFIENEQSKVKLHSKQNS
ncbi:LysR family transcriptional regulator [Pseudolactococcus yaeyamensis]